MKKYSSLFLALICFLGISSCKKNFLDKAPGVDVTENTVFSSKVNLDLFINTTYKYAMHSLFRYQDQNIYSTTVPVLQTDVVHPTSSITDEGDASEAGFITTNEWNAGTIQSGDIVRTEDYRYYIRWIALRQIKLILNRIDEVPDADAAYKNQVKGEMKVLRAMNYMEMIKRYGGVPIVDTVFEAGVPVNVPRSSLQDCINFVLKDCDDAIANTDLPAAFSAVLKGRANKATAHAIKSKVLLFAASPQFNTANPWLSMDNPANNKLICLGNVDASRWQKAADAAKAAIDYVEGNGYALIDVPANRNPALPASGAIPIAGNYRNSWEQYNNSEIILSYQGFGTTNTGNQPLKFINPVCYGSFWSGVTLPLNFLRKYEKLDGTPMTWDAAGGTDLLGKYAQLDPRFRQSINFTASYYNAANPISLIFNGGKDYANCKGGTWVHKYIPFNTAGNFVMPDVIFRVNELYMNYAEASNETGTPAGYTEAYVYINKIRLRSGMPALPAGLSQAALRDRIRNEIAIELFFDDHRMWDIRRWGIAEQEGVMQGKFEGLQINRTGTAPNYLYSWLPYTFENRTFGKRMYLHPFPQAEFLKGNLVQNPGYF